MNAYFFVCAFVCLILFHFICSYSFEHCLSKTLFYRCDYLANTYLNFCTPQFHSRKAQMTPPPALNTPEFIYKYAGKRIFGRYDMWKTFFWRIRATGREMEDVKRERLRWRWDFIAQNCEYFCKTRKPTNLILIAQACFDFSCNFEKKKIDSKNGLFLAAFYSSNNATAECPCTFRIQFVYYLLCHLCNKTMYTTIVRSKQIQTKLMWRRHKTNEMK